MLTDRLELRLPVEADRGRFVELFTDEAFMVFSGVLGHGAAHRRFDHMLAVAEETRVAKQPVIERSSGTIIGYAGVDRFALDGHDRWEFGYRLVPRARGRGLATEAGRALLAAAGTFPGAIFAVVDPANRPSQHVAGKLGFVFSRHVMVDRDVKMLYRLEPSARHRPGGC